MIRKLALATASAALLVGCGGGDVNLLGEALRHATGKRLDAFSEEVLFESLGITDYRWNMLNEDVVYASGEIYLRPRDMAKIGLLHLTDEVLRLEDLLIVPADLAGDMERAVRHQQAVRVAPRGRPPLGVDDPGAHDVRLSRKRWIFPVAVFGSASVKTTERGYL